MGTIDEEFVVEIFMGEKCLNILLANLMVKGEQSWLTVSELWARKSTGYGDYVVKTYIVFFFSRNGRLRP